MEDDLKFDPDTIAEDCKWFGREWFGKSISGIVFCIDVCYFD
jgi:hypothetical protein